MTDPRRPGRDAGATAELGCARQADGSSAGVRAGATLGTGLSRQVGTRPGDSLDGSDWAADVDPERVTAGEAPAVAGPVAATLQSPRSASSGEKQSPTRGSRVKAQLSQFMHGEQGAMMAAAKIVETVPWIDAKYYAATQTMDEARHTEVFALYLHAKIGEAYPMSPFLKGRSSRCSRTADGTSPTSVCRSSSRASLSPPSADCCARPPSRCSTSCSAT